MTPSTASRYPGTSSVAGSTPDDVAARAERATLAPQHERADAGFLGAAVRGIQLTQRIEREGVELVGGVESDLGHIVGDGEVDHGSSYTS